MMIFQVGYGKVDWDRMRKKNYLVKRKDGGDYVALASVYREENYDEVTKHELFCGPMFVSNKDTHSGSWSLSTEYDDREFGWIDNKDTDYAYLYRFMRGELPKTEGTLDRYVRLYDRGLLVNIDGKDEVNVIVQKIDMNGAEKLLEIINEKCLPPSDAFRKKLQALIQKRVAIEKQYFPSHMHEMLEIFRTVGGINKIKVIDELLERGVLKPLTERQRKGVMVILYADCLPVKDEN